jgi:hypothetical protein
MREVAGLKMNGSNAKCCAAAQKVTAKGGNGPFDTWTMTHCDADGARAIQPIRSTTTPAASRRQHTLT